MTTLSHDEQQKRIKAIAADAACLTSAFAQHKAALGEILRRIDSRDLDLMQHYSDPLSDIIPDLTEMVFGHIDKLKNPKARFKVARAVMFYHPELRSIAIHDALENVGAFKRPADRARMIWEIAEHTTDGSEQQRKVMGVWEDAMKKTTRLQMLKLVGKARKSINNTLRTHAIRVASALLTAES